MKKLLLVAVFLALTTPLFAYGQYDNDQWGNDAWGHRTKVKNYYNDSDGDGVVNFYDRNDRNRYIH